MCFGSRKDGDTGVARSREIDKQIRQDEKRMTREVKLLLLGAGESGKSTILKQMKLIYTQGFSKSEKLEWKPVIFNNIVQSFKTIHDAMNELNISFEKPESEVRLLSQQPQINTSRELSNHHGPRALCPPGSPGVMRAFTVRNAARGANRGVEKIQIGGDWGTKHMALVLIEREIGLEERMPLDYLEPVKALWQDAGVKAAIAKGNEYALHDNLSYFIEDVDRLWAVDYVPNDQDLLRSRLRTTGITETIFDLGQLTYRMFDVGGQRSERKKWIHCFENVNCLLFLVAISGYDQCLVEDKDGNQMNEALMLWESIVNSHWFTKSALILFLNKMDLFREKLPRSPIGDYGFTDYAGPAADADSASKYFLDKFRALNRNPEKEIYGHFTNATDTNLLKITMGSVQDMIIQRNLKQLIL
ncbi:unnamed protein product [Clonostachys rosea f. rosea IK726]|uniref:Guanine nucleotide-binding protein alpha-2 subunit n=2 Tax=Bionectria ochroleuca TaxID=29856 RepID=A0A0B7KDS8_BIOOC|nr:unnamed protein product [Clonostachys rosea f. rosea IK726]